MEVFYDNAHAMAQGRCWFLFLFDLRLGSGKTWWPIDTLMCTASEDSLRYLFGLFYAS